MFNQKKQPPIKSLIAHGTTITGNVDFAEGLRVDGHIVGYLRANADHPSIVVISESAFIKGEVTADHIIINGEVQGPVNATELLELQPKAKIRGDISYKALEMHQGAVISGQLIPKLGSDDKPVLKLQGNK